MVGMSLSDLLDPWSASWIAAFGYTSIDYVTSNKLSLVNHTKHTTL